VKTRKGGYKALELRVLGGAGGAGGGVGGSNSEGNWRV
jgi:hypothetical protein